MASGLIRYWFSKCLFTRLLSRLLVCLINNPGGGGTRFRNNGMCRAKSAFQNRTLTVQFKMVEKVPFQCIFSWFTQPLWCTPLFLSLVFLKWNAGKAVNVREKRSLGNFPASSNHQTIETFSNKWEVKTFIYQLFWICCKIRLLLQSHRITLL